MKIESIGDPSLLTSCFETWRELSPTPMQTPEWQLAWWRAYADHAMRLHALVVSDDDGRMVGIAPLYCKDSWGTGPRFRLLGSGPVCSDFQTILVRDGLEHDVGRAVAQWLSDYPSQCQPNRRPWNVCELDGVGEGEAAIEAALCSLRSQACVIHRKANENTWRLSLDGGWDRTLTRQSKSQRKQNRNLINRLDKYPNLELAIASTPQEIPAALDDLRRLHQLRWEAVGKKGCFSDQRFDRFAKMACADLSAQGGCQIFTLIDQGQAVASQWVLSDGNGYYVYQTGRDPQRESERVGRILNLAMLRHACENGLEFVNYLRGNEQYKAQLGAVPAACCKVRIVAPRPLPRLSHRAYLIGGELKRTVKRWFTSQPAERDA